MNAFFIARWFNDQSIRKKLILTFLAITLVPMGLLAYLSDRATRTALTESAKDALFSVASQTAASIDTFINNDRENVIIESQLPILQNYLSIPAGERENGAIEKEVRELLYNLHNLHASEEPEGKTYLLGYSLLDRSGTIILDTHIPPFTPNPFIGLDWSDRSYYLQTALTGLPYSSPVEVPQDTGDAGIYFAARIINKANQPIGVLVTHYNSIVLQDILAKNNGLAGDGSFGVLFDENLIHLAHGTRPDTIFKTVAPIDENKLAQLQHAKRLPNLPASELFLNLPDLENSLKNVADQPFFTAEDIATGELLNQVAVARLESYPWIVAFFQPQEIFLAPAAQQTANTLLLSAFITIVTVGVGLFAAQTLATPITRLTSTAEEIVTGDLTAQAEATSEDEIGTLARTFNTMTSQLRQTLEGLEQRVAERTALLRTSAEVGQAASSILDPDELIEQTVNLITDRFGYYYAAIFLVDDFGEWAELKGATGEAGKTLKTRSHRLRVGGQSMVGMAVATRRGQIALDVGKEAIRFDNPLLPDTRSEIALPLIAGNRAIGALDVQSTQGAAFGEQDIETLQNMANQVAIAIENARLFQEAQHRLNEISRLNQIFLSEGWQSFSKTIPQAVQYKQNQVYSKTNPEIPNLETAIRDRTTVTQVENGNATATVPLTLRGQIVGVFNLKSARNEWAEDELSIIEVVAGQTALALENARLIEQTQHIARREQQINQIATKIRRSVNIETILKTTLSELSMALGVQEATIQFGQRTNPKNQNP